MKKLLTIVLVALMVPLLTSTVSAKKPRKGGFVKVNGVDLMKPDGTKLFIKGTNFGNWLNPEGYMFGFKKTNSAWMIDLMFKQLVGPDKTAEFWEMFKDNYVTREDVKFIASTGANTVRLPFNYRMFTDEDYMGRASNHDGFERIDSVVAWCREYGMYLILDMHDCPGGQTGDNIDDSYGYPWIFESEPSQVLFCEIWKKIARRYAKETIILGYELMNEPIADLEKNHKDLHDKLEPLYKRAVKAIREVDKNHIILLGGARWNSDFFMFKDWKFDNNIMYTCHRYGSKATKRAIKAYTDHRDMTGLPMYMGELGHNTMEWQKTFSRIMKECNIGYTYWPYKRVDSQCMVAIKRPELWDSLIVKFAEGPRTTYADIRAARPDQKKAWEQMVKFIENCRLVNCIEQKEYIESMSLRD